MAYPTFVQRTILMRECKLAHLQGGFFLCQKLRALPEDRQPVLIERLRNVFPRASDVVRSNIGRVAFLSAYTNYIHNVTPNTTASTGGNLATASVQGRNSNSTIRAARKRAKIQKRSTEGVRSACALHTGHSFAQLISPKLFTRAYPCSLRVGIGMTTR